MGKWNSIPIGGASPVAQTHHSDEEALISVSRKWNFGDNKILKLGTDEIRRQVQRLRAPPMNQYLVYDPRESLKKIQCPLLSITGGLDELIIPNKNVAQARSALGDNPDATVLEWPGLSHFLICEWTGPALPEWDRQASYSPEIRDFVTNWILMQQSNETNQPNSKSANAWEITSRTFGKISRASYKCVEFST